MPSILPSIVSAERLGAANALETLCYSMSGVVGAPLAGLLVARIGAPGVLWLDSASYVAFAVLLTTVRFGVPAAAAVAPEIASTRPASGYRAPLRLLFRQPILLSTTLMYLVLNIGGGALLVWLPRQRANWPMTRHRVPGH